MQKPRVEDRRSCHHLTYVIGLALLAGATSEAQYCFAVLLRVVKTIPDQEPN